VQHGAVLAYRFSKRVFRRHSPGWEFQSCRRRLVARDFECALGRKKKRKAARRRVCCERAGNEFGAIHGVKP